MQARSAAVDEHDGPDNHGGGNEHVERDGFASQEPAEKNGNDGIDVGVCRHESRRIVLHEPVVGREGHN